MHNEWTTGAGCFLSWEDRIKEGVGWGDQKEAAQRQCCQIAVLPCQGTLRPQPLPFCLLLSVSIHPAQLWNSFFQFQGKWQVEDITTQSIRKSTRVTEEWRQLSVRLIRDFFPFKIHSAILSRTIMNFVGYNSFTNHNWSLFVTWPHAVFCEINTALVFSTPAQLSLSSIKEPIVPGVSRVMQAHLSLPDVALL